MVTADSNETKIFLDGGLIDTGVGGSNLDIGAGLRIGGRFTNSGRFTGFMDEILIYNRVLTGEEITQIYNGALTWDFDSQSWTGECTE